ncbi:hypothetical protein Ndes2437B_g05062 [Nannochloris sp. 'desiccata']
MGSSMLVQFTTKAIFTTYGFHFPMTVAMLQMAFISPVTYLLARPILSWQLLRGLAPLAIVNVLNVVSGLVGTAMGIMIGGALIAAATDLTFNPSGYAAVLCNDLLTSLYLIMVKNTPATNGLSTTGMLFYNSTLSLPMLLMAMIYMGEPRAVLTYPQLYSPNFLLVLFLASALGLSINHSTFVCTRINEPLMTSVAGNLKNAVMTVVGAFAFPDFIFEPANAAGLMLSMTGAIWYATRSALRARQKSIKGSVLQQQPIIGRDRLRKLSGGGSMDDRETNPLMNRIESLDMRMTQPPLNVTTN